MKRILSSFSLSGLFRKRQKLDDNRDADGAAHSGGSVQAATPERVPNEMKHAPEKNDNGRHAIAEASLGQISRRLRIRKTLDADDDTDEDEHVAGIVQAGAGPRTSQPPAQRTTASPMALRRQAGPRPRGTIPTRKRRTAVRDATPRLPRRVDIAGRFVVPRDVLRRLEVLNGYYFEDVSLLEEAFYLGSRATVIGGRVVMEANLRLAMVGDRALALVWWDHWYDRHESRGVGQQRYQLASDNSELAAIGWHHCLDDFVTNDKGFVGRTLSAKRMADTVEAFIGAVFLDSGRDLEAVKHVMIALMGRKRVDSA